MKNTLSDRQAVWAFILGCIAVTAGVCAHLPMFAMARTMLAGMALIVLGRIVAAFGLLPRNVAASGQRRPTS